MYFNSRDHIYVFTRFAPRASPGRGARKTVHCLAFDRRGCGWRTVGYQVLHPDVAYYSLSLEAVHGTVAYRQSEWWMGRTYGIILSNSKLRTRLTACRL